MSSAVNPSPVPRSVHLVGTIPAESTSDALHFVSEVLGDTIRYCVPDGETGNRLDWINRIIESHRSHPDLELASEGGWTGYDDTPAFRVRKGRSFERLELDYLEEFERSWPAFEEFRAGYPGDLALQVGIPGHIDLSFVSFGFKLRRGLRHLAPFREATIREITEIYDKAGADVVFQLEVPIELILLTKLPAPARRTAAARLAKEAVRVAQAAPAGARFGIHLCYGDLNHESLGSPKDAGPLVLFANALLRHWPQGRPLEFLHAPFALAKEPPPLEHSYYRPLENLRLPDSVRFAGGFVHEGRDLEQLITIRDGIEWILARRIDVGASCGLGRRDRERARANLELSRRVATA